MTKTRSHPVKKQRGMERGRQGGSPATRRGREAVLRSFWRGVQTGGAPPMYRVRRGGRVFLRFLGDILAHGKHHNVATPPWSNGRSSQVHLEGVCQKSILAVTGPLHPPAGVSQGSTMSPTRFVIIGILVARPGGHLEDGKGQKSHLSDLST
jgi:hypothetical protein